MPYEPDGERRFPRFALRITKASGYRIAEDDVEGLAELPALANELDAATQVTVDGLWPRR